MVLRVVVAAVVFVGTVAATFPVDAVVRWGVGRALPAGVPALAFDRARVRPWGVELDGVSMAGMDGAPIVDRVTVTPSLRSLLVHGTALPCRIRAAACGGIVDASIEGDGRMSACWHDIEVARCAPGGRVAGILGGVIDGRARVRVGDPGADGAHGRGGTRVALNGLAVRGPELDVTGAGTVEVGGATRDTSLDLTLRIVPGATATAALRALLADVPATDASGARRIAVRGSLAEPRVDLLP